MNPDLAALTQSIYQDYNPLAHPGRSLLGKVEANAFQQLVDKKTDGLCKKQKKRIQDEIFGWGPLTPLLEQEDILDIMVQGPNHIYIENREGLFKLEDQFLSDVSFTHFIERICQEGKGLINQKEPFVNTRVQSFRVHLVGPPIVKEFHLTLRKHRSQVIPLESMYENQFLNETQLRLIQELIEKKANVLIVGPTGSGKTTLLNSILYATPKNQRSVIIEDTDEILTNNKLHTKLLSRELSSCDMPPIKMEDLVKQSLRMRPDRLIVGEVRGREAKDLMQALSTGHSGSFGTLHAEDPRQALIRLEMLIQMGAPQWQLEAIRRLIQLSLTAIITLKSHRQKKGIASITRLASLEKFGFLLEDYNSYPVASSY